MSRAVPPSVAVHVVTDYTAEVRGHRVRFVLDRLQIPKLYQHRPPSGGSPCWTVQAHNAADVEAMAEHLGGSCVVEHQAVLS